MKRLLFCCLCLLNAALGAAYTRQDTLRGSNGRGRDWWDVVRYDLTVKIDTADRSISGTVSINFKITGKPIDSIQIDLQEPMIIDRVSFLSYSGDAQIDMTPPIKSVKKDGNVWWVIYPFGKEIDSKHYQYALQIRYHGTPRIANNPPWDGGFIWTKDSLGKPWIAVACQGLGASSWWPCKDYQGDEPNDGMTITVVDTIGCYPFSSDSTEPTIVSNGKYHFDDGFWDKKNPDSFVLTSTKFDLRNPINTYNTTFYIGDYAHWHDTLHGEKGILDLDFYPLKYNEAKARRQWTQAKEMLRCFEYWLGPYPFYEDGYKLVEAPYLGMEHQSAIAYGNGYQNGYNACGTMIDRSGTGVGFSFDFIIIHESGHEWFGNSITARDIADNWLHEGFTTYTEELFAEWIKGRDSGFAYTIGEWKGIKNDRPVIGDYGVNNEGSGDMYDKGAAVVHMIRMMINDDKKFRELLRGLNRDFYHKIVSSKEVEDYISKFIGRDLKAFFDVYLRSTTIPTLVCLKPGGKYRTEAWFQNVPENFSLPVYGRNGVFRFNLSTKMQKVRWDDLAGFSNYLLVRQMHK